MNDPIERQAAIDALCNDYCSGHQDCKHYPECENLKSVQKLPSAQRWTPVSEKPIPKGLVFVTYNDGDVDLLSQPTSYRRGDIVAWMPSPEPWKGDNNEYTN